MAALADISINGDQLTIDLELNQSGSFLNYVTASDEFGADVNTSVELYFHRTTLSEAGFYPEIGDIVDWNDTYFEINAVTEPQLIAGHQNFKHSRRNKYRKNHK